MAIILWIRSTATSCWRLLRPAGEHKEKRATRDLWFAVLFVFSFCLRHLRTRLCFSEREIPHSNYSCYARRTTNHGSSATASIYFVWFSVTNLHQSPVIWSLAGFKAHIVSETSLSAWVRASKLLTLLKTRFPFPESGAVIRLRLKGVWLTPGELAWFQALEDGLQWVDVALQLQTLGGVKHIIKD